MSISKFLRNAAFAGALIITASATTANAELLASCGFSAGSTVNGDNINRGFYLTNYPGQSLQSIKLRHEASVAGTYQITVTARLGSYAGPIIGEPYTAAVVLATSSGTNVTYQLGDMPVAPGSTIAFSMAATGPGAVLFDVAVPAACPNVVETENTSPPLSTVRRDRVGYEVYGRAATQSFYNCPFDTGGDGVDRGIYITNYPGETLRTVSIRYEVLTAGVRQLRLTARQGGYNGSIVGTPRVKTLNMLAGAANGQIVEWDFGGAFVDRLGTITFTHEVISGNSSIYHSSTTGACPNVFETEGTTGTLDTLRGTRGIRVTGDREAGFRQIVEYYIPALNHFFISGRPNEQSLLDQYPGVYQRTGTSFLGFPSVDAPQGSVPVCRFYLPPGLGGPNSHFYGQPADCNLIIGTGNPAFVFEGYDFALYTPVGGVCPNFAPNKVYRSFNNRTAQNDGNHRYTTTVGNYNGMTAIGWTPEGAVFCSDLTAP